MAANYSFDGLNLEFENRGIHTLLTEVFELRPQLTTRKEAKAQGGWTNELNTFLMDSLDKLADVLERITYRDPTIGKEQSQKNAADTSRSLKQETGATTINTQNVLQPPARTYRIAHDLTGAHPDFPQVDTKNYPNAWFRDFITGLDSFAVEASRLTSRSLPIVISQNESAMLRARLQELFAICTFKGGEENRSDRPTGTLPSQEPPKVAAAGATQA